MDFETPEADAAEQRQQDALDAEEDQADSGEIPMDVDAADLAEQRAAVPDDDGYEHD